MAFAFTVIDTVRGEEPQLFDAQWAEQVHTMLEEALECERELQDVQELTNFFERRVSAYQVAVPGEVCFNAAC